MAYRVFISHVWRTHGQYYDGVVRLLERAKYFRYKELGVPRRRQLEGDGTDPFDAMDEILEIVRSADALIVISTPVTGSSKNVLLEVQEARKYGIPVIAVTPRRKKPSIHPEIASAPKVAWIGSSIAKAIRDEVRQSRNYRVRNIIATVDEEVTSIAEAAYQPIEDIAKEVNLSPTQLEEVRGEDEVRVAYTMPSDIPSPRDVILGDDEIVVSLPVAPVNKKGVVSAVI